MKIKAQAPCRISLFGGGTDLPVFYEKYGGCVINMAINIRQYLEIDTWYTGSAFGFATSIPGSKKEFYEKILKYMGNDRLFLNTRCDGYIEAGLGSSASATVAFVAALARIKNNKLSRQDIAEVAWQIETEEIGLYGGKQDQLAASFGGMNYFEFSQDDVEVRSFEKQIAEFWSNQIALFYIGKKRENPKIQEQLLKPKSSQVKALTKIRQTCKEAWRSIELQNISNIVDLLNDSWEQKKRSNPLVTNDHIDGLYKVALKNGSLAGKLCGSGGGGYMFFICPPEKQSHLIETMQSKGASWTDFSIDYNGVETRIL